MKTTTLFPTRKTASETMLSALVLMALAASTATAKEGDLPIDHRKLEKYAETSGGKSGLTNAFSLEHIYDAVRDGDASSLSIDFTHVKELLNGQKLDVTKLYGRVSAGPYPFESKESRFSYKRFRISSTVSEGKAKLYVDDLLNPPINSEGWTDSGQIAVRFELMLESSGRDRKLGTYDTVAAFRKDKKKNIFLKVPSFVEGPFVNLVRSDDPTTAVISFVTHEKVRARAIITDADGKEATFYDEWSRSRHEIEVKGLTPGASYWYEVDIGSRRSRKYMLQAAPARSADASVVFSYFGDSRSGTGGGLASYMGVNYLTLERHARTAYSRGSQFMIVGGDLVNGYTTVRSDFEAQLHAWKQAMTGFWSERPVYAAMGNHEALLKKHRGVRTDRWPYDTDSAEAVFARVFVHPKNGPATSDPRRPTYKENVYSFQYGCVRAIAFNNNYWYSGDAPGYGGCPEGYLLEDQLTWILAELEAAESDETVRYVLLFAQEPVFPNGGHLHDSMWHNGDNRVRAHFYKDEKIHPAERGMISVRNALVRAVASTSKVAAVLGSDEHAYHRVLIGKEVPIGEIPKDDTNLNGKIDVEVGETASPLADLERSTWYIVCGGGGAPYYAEQKTPWNEFWKDKQTPSGVTGHFYSSQENILLFDATPERIAVTIYNPHGEVIDTVPDLMADR